MGFVINVGLVFVGSNLMLSFARKPLPRGRAAAHILLRDRFAWFLHEAHPQQLVMAFKHTTDQGPDSDSCLWSAPTLCAVKMGCCPKALIDALWMQCGNSLFPLSLDLTFVSKATGVNLENRSVALKGKETWAECVFPSVWTGQVENYKISQSR